ncbi:hypothetical protein QYE76_066473 [Lolium multiflorum]|uniref:Uncharacterized protein n=1 Tax=Lolium multiflorum TaxID=4521 RepID=A0AAD8SBL7_LOLMU|nr:hypothetical protein QYE76_066473 [Lolium multiflorum]
MDKLFEGLDDDSNLSVKEMKSRFLAYDAEKKKKEDELQSQMAEMSVMLKNLTTSGARSGTSGSKETYNEVNHDYPRNTSPMPHINHSGTVPHFDGTHFPHWKSSMESHIRSCSVELWEIILHGYREPQDPIRLTSTEFYNRQLNASARDKIRSGINRKLLDQVNDIGSAKELWDRIVVLTEGTDLIQSSLYETAKQEAHRFMIREGESLADAYARLGALKVRIKGLGAEKYDDGFEMNEGFIKSKVIAMIAVKQEDTNLALNLQIMTKSADLNSDDLVSYVAANENMAKAGKMLMAMNRVDEASHNHEASHNLALKARADHGGEEEYEIEEDEEMTSTSDIATDFAFFAKKYKGKLLIRLQPAGGTFMSITLGAATKLLDDMMINYSEWHTERAPQGKKVNSVEETSSLSDKIDVIMSMLVNGRSNVDPNNVPLASLVAQEENVDVNFIKNNNFNNNAYRNNSGNNYRPYPSANGNGYGNSYGNSYNNNRSVPSGLEAMLKEFISTQTAFNKSVEEKLDKIDTIASRVDRLASDVNLLKLKVMPNNDLDNKITTTANAIQVRINENIRLMAELRARWDREENEKLAKENNVAKVWTITTTSNANSSHVAAPPTINGKIIGVGNASTPSAKRTKLPEIAKTAETACDKTAEIFSNLGNNDPIAVAHNDLDFDDCHISEVIKFLQKLAKSPNASAINLAFTKHITNALIKAREDKLKLETSIPRKLEDGWEPIIKMKFNDFECNALCDLGASISVMPKKIYDMLDLPPLKNCYLDVNLADNVKKKPLGRIDNVHITVNNNLVPVDFVVLDIECNASCPIVLGRPFLRTVGAVIDMREGNIKYQFPLKKGMEHFPRKRMKLPFDSIIRTSYDVDASTLDVT